MTNRASPRRLPHRSDRTPAPNRVEVGDALRRAYAASSRQRPLLRADLADCIRRLDLID